MTELLSKPLAVAFGSISRNWVPHVSIFETWEIATLNCFVSGHEFSRAEQARI